MRSYRDPRKLSKSYIEEREARRTGRRRSRQAEFGKEFRSNVERDIRAEIERHERALKDQNHKETNFSEEPLRRWWQFWKRSKPRTEGWD